MAERARPPLAAIAASGVLSLIAGYLVYTLIEEAIHAVWVTVPGLMDSPPLWYPPLILIPAAIGVYLIRRHMSDPLHSPLDGIGIVALTPRAYLGAILAIAVSLIGGAVLGPEVALVSTGAVIGGLVARWRRVSEARPVVLAGVGGAVLALFVNPLLTGSLSLPDPPANLAMEEIAWALPVAGVIAIIVILARLLGTLLAGWAGPGIHPVVLVVAAAVIAVGAMAFQLRTGELASLVATSGAEYISELPTLTDTTTLAALLIIKAIAYGVCLGSGFRGGPFFPAMFLGAAGGLLLAELLPSGPDPVAAAGVGVAAAVIVTARMPWWVAVVLGIVIGYAIGGPVVIPAAVVGGFLAWLLVRVTTRWGLWGQSGGNQDAGMATLR